MKKKALSMAVILVLPMVFSIFLANASDKVRAPGEYTIGPGDVLNVSVWKNDALTRQVAVLPDGTVSLPLVGQIQAAGKTVAQFTKEIRQRFSRYMPKPVLNISVMQINSMIVYVIGHVKNPGRFQVHANVNILQSLAMAGGLDRFARRNKIKVFRERGSQTRIFNFRYDEVVDGKRLAQNLKLMRGDVVVVP